MRDVVEEQLAARLHDLGAMVSDELVPPAELEVLVAKHRNRARATRRWAVLAIAAAITATVTSAAVVQGVTGDHKVSVASPTTIPFRDPLPAGTVMLSARGPYVIAVNKAGHQIATMVHAEHGEIAYARATADHRSLWYLSFKRGRNACGDVVRADIEGRSSTIVTHALAFDISPDGTRLAFYGAGDLAHGACAVVNAKTPNGRIVVVDVASSTSRAIAAKNITGLHWSPDGSHLVSVSCAGAKCAPLERIDVPAALGAHLVRKIGFAAVPVSGATAVFGPDGLVVLQPAKPRAAVTVNEYNAETLRFSRVLLATGGSWTFSQVVPTPAGTFVVASRPHDTHPSLYRVEARKLVLVRADLDGQGVFSPVGPIAR